MKVLLLSRSGIITNSLPFLRMHELKHVNTSEEAIQKLSSEKFDVVVVFDDLEESSMPGQVISKIKEKFKEVPVVFFSYTEQSASIAKIYGADKVITYPYFYNNSSDLLTNLLQEFEKRKFEAPGEFKEQAEEARRD